MPVDATRFVRKDMMATPFDRELVVLNLPRNDYVLLDEPARRIWELLESPRRADDLCQILGSEFEGPADEIARDVGTFLDQLLAEGMVEVVMEE